MRTGNDTTINKKHTKMKILPYLEDWVNSAEMQLGIIANCIYSN